MDGDGCIFNKNGTRNISLAGTYNQRWDEMINLCKRLDIDFLIKKRINKHNHKGSVFYISNCRNANIIFLR